MAPLDGRSRPYKYELLGRPLKQVISWIDLKKTGELVPSLTIPETLRTEQFYLGGFGLAMKLSDPTPPGQPPLTVRSPGSAPWKEPKSSLWHVDLHGYLCSALLWQYLSPRAGRRRHNGHGQPVGAPPNFMEGIYTGPGDALDFWYDPNTYHPEKRLTAAQSLQGPLFKVIVEKYGC